MSQIHPTAIIEKGAHIGANVTIGPYACIHKNVRLEDNVEVMAHSYIDGHTTIGQGTVIYPGAVIGTKTQDLKYKDEVTYVTIGKNCQIRECVTINASCGEGTAVSIGDSCLLMAYCHVAHNSTIGSRVIMANGATLAGHVIVEDCAVIGGLSAVHQFSRIGRYAMVGGMSRVTHDVPPFTIGSGSPYTIGGLNLVGLKRHGFSLEKRKVLTKAFRYLYRMGLSVQEALKKTEEDLELTPELQDWLQFCKTTKRGLIDISRSKNSQEGSEDL
jgi:UDP-N-acetylglucosamine acyltransferase